MARCALLLLICAADIRAGTVESAEVGYQAGRYTLDLTMHIDGDPQAVYALVTDYDALERLSDTIMESELLDSSSGDHKRRRLVTRVCILFFCFRSAMVEDVVENGEGTIATTIVPALSDYRYGESVWRIAAAESGARIHFQTTLEPDFWIPPLIGTWLLQQKMRTEAERTILAVERLARDD